MLGALFVTWAHLAAFQAGTSGPAAERLTFNKDIAPIVIEHCAPCHRPGGAGGFDLTSYRNARPRAKQIADVTARRVMPPWMPDPNDVRFEGERRLSEHEIEAFRLWAAQGAIEGSPTGSATRVVRPATSDWQLGTPDLVVSMPKPYRLPPQGSDVFRTFVIQIPTSVPRYVKALEFQPVGSSAVHHANIGVDRTRSSRRLDALDPEPGYTGSMVLDATYPPGQMLGWTPGQFGHASPEGAAWRLERDSDLVVQLHLQPTGREELVQIRVGFFFTDKAPVRTPVGLRLGSETIDIPPNDSAYVITDAYTLPVDVDAFAIKPHAHNVAREIQAMAVLPDGTTRSLLSIRRWEFRWQETYYFAEPVALPKGTRIFARITYDNSSGNRRNPFQPPRRIVWGPNTTDEMGDVWIQLLSRRPEDFDVLNEDVNRKKSAEDLIAYRKLLDVEPNNPLRHDALAALYLTAGNLDEAIDHLRQSLRLNSAAAPTHYNLGLALAAKRDFPRAAAAFEQAIALDPEHAEAHNNLGGMLQIAGRTEAALDEYSRAVQLRPDNAEAHSNLGRLLATQGRTSEAILHLRQAVSLRADLVPALAGLARELATASDRDRDVPTAISLAERANALANGRDPLALDALSVAYAAGGRIDEALAAARAGVERAMSASLPSLAEELRLRAADYERRASRPRRD